MLNKVRTSKYRKLFKKFPTIKVEYNSFGSGEFKIDRVRFYHNVDGVYGYDSVEVDITYEGVINLYNRMLTKSESMGYGMITVMKKNRRIRYVCEDEIKRYLKCVGIDWTFITGSLVIKKIVWSK